MNTCQTCRFAALTQHQCKLTNISITDKDYCSKHSAELINCELCNNLMLPNAAFIVPTNGAYRTLCGKCAANLTHCVYCRQNNLCEFETNADSSPKVILQEQRQGNMVMQTQIKNPERVKKFCYSCSCWNTEEEVCFKEYGIGCINHRSSKIVT